MARCENCGVEIPDSYETKLCNVCFGKKFLASFKNNISHNSTYTNSSGISETFNSSKKYVEKIIKEKGPVGRITDLTVDEINNLLKTNYRTKIILMEMIRKRSAILINGLIFCGNTYHLLLDIKKVVEERNVSWLKSLSN